MKVSFVQVHWIVSMSCKMDFSTFLSIDPTVLYLGVIFLWTWDQHISRRLFSHSGLRNIFLLPAVLANIMMNIYMTQIIILPFSCKHLLLSFPMHNWDSKCSEGERNLYLSLHSRFSQFSFHGYRPKLFYGNNLCLNQVHH